MHQPTPVKEAAHAIFATVFEKRLREAMPGQYHEIRVVAVGDETTRPQRGGAPAPGQHHIVTMWLNMADDSPLCKSFLTECCLMSDFRIGIPRDKRHDHPVRIMMSRSAAATVLGLRNKDHGGQQQYWNPKEDDARFVKRVLEAAPKGERALVAHLLHGAERFQEFRALLIELGYNPRVIGFYS